MVVAMSCLSIYMLRGKERKKLLYFPHCVQATVTITGILHVDILFFSTSSSFSFFNHRLCRVFIIFRLHHILLLLLTTTIIFFFFFSIFAISSSSSSFFYTFSHSNLPSRFLFFLLLPHICLCCKHPWTSPQGLRDLPASLASK